MFREQGLAVIGISTMDTPARIKDFSGKYGLSYLQLRDPGAAFFEHFGDTSVIPRTIVLDRRHRIVLLELGYTEEKLARIVAAVRAALAEPSGR